MRVVQHELNSTKILKILTIYLGLITREIVANGLGIFFGVGFGENFSSWEIWGHLAQLNGPIPPQNGLFLTDQSEVGKASKSNPVSRASHVIHHSFLDLLLVALRSDKPPRSAPSLLLPLP
jgi:hypothetical protein